MDEFYLFGMEVKAVGTGAVKDVAFDGTSEAVWMGAVDAELMGAAGLGIELDAVLVGEDVVGEGGLAHAVVDHLAGGIEGIAGEGEGDSAFTFYI